MKNTQKETCLKCCDELQESVQFELYQLCSVCGLCYNYHCKYDHRDEDTEIKFKRKVAFNESKNR